MCVCIQSASVAHPSLFPLSVCLQRLPSPSFPPAVNADVVDFDSQAGRDGKKEGFVIEGR